MSLARRAAPPRSGAEFAPPRSGAEFAPPLTTTRSALLVDGSDQLFRALVRDLMTLSSLLQALRAGLARRLGVSEPEYRVFLAVAQLQGEAGVAVGTVARHLGVTGAFVTMVVQRLVRSGHLKKTQSRVDRRGVLLTLTASGRRTIAEFAPAPQRVNDALFGGIAQSEFRLLADVARRLVAGGERAVLLARAGHDERSTGGN